MNETVEGIRDKFFKWNEAFESNGLKVNLGNAKVMVKLYPCGVCSLREKGN